MNIEVLIKYWNGISSLFLEMAPYLMLGFLISGIIIKTNIPLKRIGKLEDLISAVDFLISEGSNYMTGQFIIVDGGYTAH